MTRKALHAVALVLGLAVVFTLSAFSTPSKPQQGGSDMKQPRLYTYVSFFGVPRANWTEYEKSNEKADKLNQNLINDGTLLAWGEGAMEVHEGNDAPNYVSWFVSNSVGGLMKALDSTRTGAPVTSSINYTTHFDEINQTRAYNFKMGGPSAKYLLVQDWHVKGGHSDDWDELFSKHRKAGLDAMVNDGTLCGYSVEESLIHTSEPGYISLILQFPNGESIDKFYASIDTMHEKDPLFGEVFTQIQEPAHHRDHLVRVLTSGHKQ
jgi:hypothetical protein